MNERVEVVKKILEVHDALAQNESVITSDHITTILRQQDDILKTFLREPSLLKADPPKSYKLTLIHTGERKIAIIKLIREYTHMGLKEAKDRSESTPNDIILGTIEVVEQAKRQFESEGATMTITEIPRDVGEGQQ